MFDVVVDGDGSVIVEVNGGIGFVWVDVVDDGSIGVEYVLGVFYVF